MEKQSGNTDFIVDIFPCTSKYLVWSYRESIKTVKYSGFCEKLFSENDFDTVLATFCCYEYSANASEVVRKIATDQNDDHITNALRVL